MGIADALRGLANPRLRTLPGADWETPQERRDRITEEKSQAQRLAYARLCEEFEGVRSHSGARLVDGSEKPGALRDLAHRRVDFVLERLAGTLHDIGRREAAGDQPCDDRANAIDILSRINAVVVALQGRPFKLQGTKSPFEQARQAFKRAVCPVWWSRQLKRESARAHEGGAVRTGRIGKHTRQPYCTDEAVRRRMRSNAASAAMMEATEIEDADGNTITLKAAFDASTSAKPIRRGELMTRMRGCEELAMAMGMVGLFTTNTAPSRFHSQGGRNPKYDGSTPRESHEWLCKTWQACRSKLAREQIGYFGFRVAEPHRDGCAHWHMLLWVRPDEAKRFKAIMHKWWRRDEGDEKGADRHRCLIRDMEAGGATGYVAKYVAKNIDDAGAVGDEGHRDDWDGEDNQQGDLFGGNALRVEAWATNWGIRQFQAFGQPPVTAWREFRRIESAAGGSPAMQAAHRAVNRQDEERACWRSFVEAQGGAMQGRKYRLKVETVEEAREGRYGLDVAKVPMGIVDVELPGVVLLSNRRKWRRRGTWTNDLRDDARKGLSGWARDTFLGLWARPKAAQPWTRVINCTQRRAGAADLLKRMQARNAPITEGPGGFEESTPWATPPTPPVPSATELPPWYSRLTTHLRSADFAST